MWELQYAYDGVELGDLFPFANGGFTFSKQRNGVGSISFSISLRKLYEFCVSQNFDITRMFTPIKSTIKVIHPDGQESHGGWLSATPPFSFGAGADTLVPFTFSDWLGLTAGAFIKPPLSYSGNFDVVAQQQIDLIVERTYIAGAMWPITPGDSDTLPSVSGTIDAPKSLKDFLLERADNTEGTGTFDVYADPSGVISLHTKYGVDISDTTTLSYPDDGGKFDLKEISFDAWINFVSDVFLTGAGNGYGTTSGADGAAIFATARNEATIANTGYWEIATSESDISDQTTLNAKATSYVKDTDKPFSAPPLKLDGDKFKVYAHDLGGDLWLGDTVTVDTTDWVKPLIPLETPVQLRINQIDATVNQLGHCDLTLGMIADA